jgi:hypothetical protein
MNRYGLNRNPYRVGRVDSFDPKTEMDPPLRIDGFREIDTSLREFLQRRRKEKAPAYILIRSQNGTGRTCAARHILKVYSEICQSDTLIAPVVKPNDDACDVLKRWVGPLSVQLKKAKGKLSDSITAQLEKVLAAKEFDDAKFKTDLQNLLIDIQTDYGSAEENPVVFGFCLEDPPPKFPSEDVIQAIFWEVNCIVILVYHTNLDEETEKQRRAEGEIDPIVGTYDKLLEQDAAWVFPRSKLAAADIQALAECYWEKARPGAPCPVDASSLKLIGANTPLPIWGVLSMLAAALDEMDCAAGNGLWPEDHSLQITDSLLKNIHQGFVAGSRYRNQAGEGNG